MKTFLFKGITISNGKSVFGGIIQTAKLAYILPNLNSATPVDKYNIQQFIGVVDASKNPIFTNDIVKVSIDNKDFHFVVVADFIHGLRLVSIGQYNNLPEVISTRQSETNRFYVSIRHNCLTLMEGERVIGPFEIVGSAVNVDEHLLHSITK